MIYFYSMKILRWIFGIPLAFAIVIGILWYGTANIDDGLRRLHNSYLYLAIHAFEIIFSFALLVFLACLFAPGPKKYAALATVIV
jgi:predicted outer membrane lipoprotein